MPYALLLALLLASCSGNAEHLPAQELKARLGALTAEFSSQLQNVRTITAAEALSLHSQGKAVFIDVRSDAERAVSIIPGAITQGDYTASLTACADKTPIAYCTIGYRSALLSDTAARAGTPLLNLGGGILAWIAEGGPLSDAAGRPTTRIHVYGRKWALVPPGYEPVW